MGSFVMLVVTVLVSMYLGHMFGYAKGRDDEATRWMERDAILHPTRNVQPGPDA